MKVIQKGRKNTEQSHAGLCSIAHPSFLCPTRRLWSLRVVFGPSRHLWILHAVVGSYTLWLGPYMSSLRRIPSAGDGFLCPRHLLALEFEPPSLGSTRRRWVRAAVALRRAALAPAVATVMVVTPRCGYALSMGARCCRWVVSVVDPWYLPLNISGVQ